MTRSFWRAIGVRLALLLAIGGLAFPSASLAQVTGIRDSNGVPYFNVIGIDSGTGQRCVIGVTSTCVLNIGGSVGGGASLKGETTASPLANGVTRNFFSANSFGGARFSLQSPIDGSDLDPTAPSPVTQSGTWNVGQSGAWNVGLNAGTQLQLIPGTSGGLSGFHLIAAASDNHQTIATGAHQVYTVDATSLSTSAHYIRLYDSGAGFNGCNSASNLLWGDLIPGNASGAGIVKAWEIGRPVTNGIALCVTKAATSVADTDTASADATSVVINVGYK